MYQPRAPFPEAIASARRRLGTAQRSVEILRSILVEAEPASTLAETVRDWLHERERSVYSRRLELEALLRERRQPPPPARRWAR